MNKFVLLFILLAYELIPAIINQIYKPEKRNRLTIRARENRLEYWINRIKGLDYLDPDPHASGKGLIGFQIHDESVITKVHMPNGITQIC